MQKIEENKDLLKFNAEGYDPTYIWHEAKNKAVKAVDDYMKDKEEPLYCGFASVSIHPARGKFVSFLKKQMFLPQKLKNHPHGTHQISHLVMNNVKV